MRPSPRTRVLDVALLMVLCCAVFAVSRFLFASGSARHFDTRWLYAAAECLYAGVSPYKFAGFSACWQSGLGADAPAPFVFGITILPIVFPMNLWDFTEASVYFDAVNLGAIALLGWCLWLISDIDRTQGRQRIERSGWIGLGLSMGPVSGSAFVGQPVVLVALGIALLVLGSQRRSNWMLTVGTLLCLIKPHLALLPLLIVWFREPLADFRGKLAAGISLLLLAAAVQSLGGDFATDYLASLRAHTSSTVGHLVRPETLYGFPGLVSGPSSGIELVAAALIGCAAFLAGWKYRFFLPSERDSLIMATVLLGPFLFPIKEYDLAVLSVLFALTARQAAAFRALALVPLLILWRPGLLSLLGFPAESRGSLLAVTLMCGALSVMLLGAWMAGRTGRPAAEGRQ